MVAILNRIVAPMQYTDKSSFEDEGKNKLDTRDDDEVRENDVEFEKSNWASRKKSHSKQKDNYYPPTESELVETSQEKINTVLIQ